MYVFESWPTVVQTNALFYISIQKIVYIQSKPSKSFLKIYRGVFYIYSEYIYIYSEEEENKRVTINQKIRNEITVWNRQTTREKYSNSYRAANK